MEQVLHFSSVVLLVGELMKKYYSQEREFYADVPGDITIYSVSFLN